MQKANKKVNKEKYQLMVTLNNGFQFLDMGPSFPVSRDSIYELLEPKLLAIWDAEIITSFLKKTRDIELLLASYFSNRMLLTIESFDLNKGLLPSVHAVVMIFDYNLGIW